MTDDELKSIAGKLRRATDDEAGPAPLRHAMADVITMAVTHRQDDDGCYLCETDMKGECIAWCNGMILAMAAQVPVQAAR